MFHYQNYLTNYSIIHLLLFRSSLSDQVPASSCIQAITENNFLLYIDCNAYDTK